MQAFEFNSLDDMSQNAAENIVNYGLESIKQKGFFTISLSGGNSPRQIYSLLPEIARKKGLNWNRVFIFWGDERYIPHTHRESNYKMAYDTLLSKINIPQQNIFRIPTEIEPVDSVALLYEKIMKKFFTLARMIDHKKKLPIFDLILLGIGSDGHTASLFPGHKAINEQKKWVVYVKAHARVTLRDRITITLPVINAAKNIMFIISGEGKGKIVKSIMEEKKRATVYPASKIKPEDGQTIWFIDRNIY